MLRLKKLKAVTNMNACPMPHLEGLLSRLKDTRFVSEQDLKDSFWQIVLELKSHKITLPLLFWVVRSINLP